MNHIVAACQLADTQDDIAETVAQIAHHARMADELRVTVLCFPECYFQGYTRNEELARKRAIRLDSAEFKLLLERLKYRKVTIILGVLERADGRLFNTAVVIQQGRLVGRYRKAHPNEGIFEPGTEYPIFDAEGLRFGISICNDANYPEVAEQLMESEPTVIFYPLNNRLARLTAENWRDKHVENLIARANQTGCWIVSSDIVYQDDTDMGYGFTAIVSPTGEVITQASELTEEMITAGI